MSEESGVDKIHWLPIEGAPKDGTRVLVWPPTWRGEENSMTIAIWNDDRYAGRPIPYWHRFDSLGITYCRNNPPTHYARIPESIFPEGVTHEGNT